ncbi:MAG: flavodoxin [Eubacterium sp.]|jgi:flavodoxin|uniref:flavodoxin family protein n=1 Tax=Eubacterium sp. F2 TaxID=3381348 RepID=UPI003908130C|nr:flavodoxin [Eubacterium sp.]MCI2197688.1 flavodoxin [Eubacterium sp.]
MNTAVRYYSRSGNTKLVAEAIAEALGVPAVSVDMPEAALTERADVLFIGGALYAYGIDKNLKNYLGSLSVGQVGRAVVFSTSWVSKHSIDLIRNALQEKGIPVEAETFYVRNKASQAQLEEAKSFARSMVKK